jgi:hypothetical protein
MTKINFDEPSVGEVDSDVKFTAALAVGNKGEAGIGLYGETEHFNGGVGVFGASRTFYGVFGGY